MKRIFDNIFMILGFTSSVDFLSTLFAIKNKIIYLFAILFGATFTTHFWESKEQFIFLWVLLCMDLLTGVLNAFKTKTFASNKLPRWAGICFTYSMMLFMGFNLAKYNGFFFAWLPSTLYFIFCAVLFTSIIENFNKLGWLDSSIFKMLKERLKGLISAQKKD